MTMHTLTINMIIFVEHIQVLQKKRVTLGHSKKTKTNPIDPISQF